MRLNISKEWLESRIHLEDGLEIGAGCPPDAFSMWFDEVIRIARLLGWKQTAIDSIDREAWRLYFDDGDSPAEAWRQEYESAR